MSATYNSTSSIYCFAVPHLCLGNGACRGALDVIGGGQSRLGVVGGKANHYPRARPCDGLTAGGVHAMNEFAALQKRFSLQ